MSEPGKPKSKRTLSGQEAAGRLSILAEALRVGATIDVDVAGERVSLQPAGEKRTELKSRADKRRSHTRFPGVVTRSNGERPKIARRAATQLRHHLPTPQQRRTRFQPLQTLAQHRDPLRQVRPDLLGAASPSQPR